MKKATILKPAILQSTRFILSWFIKVPIWAYRVSFSGFLGHNCRFYPTCSAYALEAINVHGPVKGLFLIFRRIARCNPLGEFGSDPVPAPGDFMMGKKNHE